MALSFLRFLNIILVALLAGTSFGIWVGFHPANYSVSTYIEQQQNLVSSLNTLMVSLVVLATLVTVACAFTQKRDKSSFFALLTAAFFLASCIVISRLGNYPIQTEMLAWTPTSYPENWVELRDKWWKFHVLRTIAELIALVIVAWTAAKLQQKD